MKSIFVMGLIVCAAVVTLMAVQARNHEITKQDNESRIESADQTLQTITESIIEYDTEIDTRSDKEYYTSYAGNKSYTVESGSFDQTSRKIMSGTD